MKARNVAVCPTLTREVSTFVYESTPEFFADPFFLREADPGVVAQLQDRRGRSDMRTRASPRRRYKAALEVARRNLEGADEAGVKIAMGTDSGPPRTLPGLLRAPRARRDGGAGLTPIEAILSATRDAAACIGLADRFGTLGPDRFADFVVLSRSPLDDIRQSKTVESVWVSGNRVQ